MLSTKEAKKSAKKPTKDATATASLPEDDSEVDPDDPALTAPRPRYNAMLAVLRNTLYMYVLHPLLLRVVQAYLSRVLQLWRHIREGPAGVHSG